MYKLISFFNKNKKTIFIVIFYTVIGFIIIRALSNYYEEKSKEEILISNSSSIKNTTTVIKNQDFDLSGSTKTESTIKEAKSIIDEYFEYCNKKQIDKAYNLLTDECKELKYPTLKDFENNYYNKIFNTTKSYTIESWNGDIYRVKIQDDFLSTGKVTNNTYTQDYITVVSTNNTQKLNINSYIKRVNISKKTENELATITVNSKDVYMDYEVYNITIKNNSNSKLLIDDLQKTNSIFLTESKGAKYSFVNYELVKEQLEVISGGTIKFSIKFNHTYRSGKKINSLTFSGIQKEINGQMDNKNKNEITINFE